MLMGIDVLNGGFKSSNGQEEVQSVTLEKKENVDSEQTQIDSERDTEKKCAKVSQ